MKITQLCPIIILLFVQQIHGGLVSIKNYKVIRPEDSPMVISELIDERIDTMPYYKDIGAKDAHLNGYSGKDILIGIIDGISQEQHTWTEQDSSHHRNVNIFQCNISSHICHCLPTPSPGFKNNNQCK
jgi:hypothetical protein